MKRVICLAVVLASVMALLAGCCLSHEWKRATCTKPKTCANCGKTEGEARGHKWTQATCTAAKTCRTCGETEGEALGHSWEDATCTSAKTCTVCDKKEGDPLEHDYKWVTTSEPDHLTEGEKTGNCKHCGDTVTEVIGKLAIEYRWNKPVRLGKAITVEFYKEGIYYCMEITSDMYDSSFLVTMLDYADGEYGFKEQTTVDWMRHLLDLAEKFPSSKVWVEDGVTYIIPDSPYGGPEWILYLRTEEDVPGCIGVKVDELSQLEAMTGVKVKN